MSAAKQRIEKSTLGDTRTADHVPTIREFNEANDAHHRDVALLMSDAAVMLTNQGQRHDWTKINEPYRSMFYQAMVRAMTGDAVFEESEWARLHYEELERHHLNRHVPKDVNLFDVIEMVCDIIAAAAARSGKLPRGDIELPDEVLRAALGNTVNLLCDEVEIVGWEETV